MIDKLFYNIYEKGALSVICSLNREVHCVVTSPPYFQKRTYGKSDEEIGKEKEVQTYLINLVEIFNSIQLHPSGSIWVNIGDKRDHNSGLMMIPERFALLMKESDWRLVDSVIWAKVVVEDDGSTIGNCNPEPAPGRLNANGYEYLYRFVRGNKDIWSDTSSVRIPRRNGDPSSRYLPEKLMSIHSAVDGRNLSNVWRTNMGQTSEKHYAVYSKSLVERPVAMTCPMFVCSQCGFIRTRIENMVEYDEERRPAPKNHMNIFGKSGIEQPKSKRVFGKYNSINEYDPAKSKDIGGRCDIGREYIPRKPQTVGWSDCGHDAYTPGIVLDPFCGSGTTGEVALKLGRSFIGVDLYQEFAETSIGRCERVLNELKNNELPDPFKSFQ